MKTYNPKTIKELPPGTKVQAFTATLTKLWPAKKGDGQYGPWTLQGGTFEQDGETVEAKFKFELPEERRGQQMLITAGTDKKGNPAGVSFETDKYRDKDGNPVEKQVVMVTAAAKLTWGGEAPQSQGDDEIPGLPSPANPAPPTPAVNGLDAVKLAIQKRANLYELCMARAVVTVPLFEQLTGEQMTPEQFQGFVGTLFIEGLRAGDHNKLPVNVRSSIKAFQARDQANETTTPE